MAPWKGDNGYYFEAWATNVTAGTGPTSVTCTPSSGSHAIIFGVVNYTGGKNPFVQDGSAATATGTDQYPTVAYTTGNRGGDLLWSVAMNVTCLSPTVASPFTKRMTGACFSSADDGISGGVSANTLQTATYDEGGAHPWQAFIIGFEADWNFSASPSESNTASDSLGRSFGAVRPSYDLSGDPTLVARWTFDEGSGSLVNDYSGNNKNPGVWQGTLGSQWTATAEVGPYAGNFNGIDNQILTPYTPGSTVASYTLSAWINPTSTDGYFTIFSPGTIYILSGKLNFRYSSTNHLSATGISSSAWTHIAVVCNAGSITYYINGVLDNNSYSGAPAFQIRYIGGHGQEYFPGIIDDARMHSRALSGAEIAALYAQVPDSVARMKGFVRGPSESNPASDVVAENGVYGRTASESNPASDAIGRLAGFGRADSESQTASDALGRLAAFGRADSESQTASDAIARLAAFGRGPSESSSASDAVARAGAFGRGPSESNTASDVIARAGVFGRGEIESNPASDAIGRLAGFGRGESESHPASDAVARLAAFSRGEAEAESFSDSLLRVQGLVRAAWENDTTLDFMTRAGVFGRTVSEWDATSDRVQMMVVLFRHIFGLPGEPKSGAVPGQPKSGAVPGQVKSGSAPVH